MKHTTPAPKRCPYCGDHYTPYIRAAKTQKSCGKTSCRKKRQRKAYKAWLAKNPTYFLGRYIKVKLWLAARPGYQRRYRAAHPEYAARDVAGRRRRKLKMKRFRADIQNGLLRRKIAGIRAIRGADIQNGLSLKLDGVLTLLSG